MATSQNITLQARGLYTFPNLLSNVPDGALAATNNVCIDRDSVVTPRRGNQIYGTAMGSAGVRAKQLMYYKDRILRHWLTNVDADSDGLGTFTILDGPVIYPAVSAVPAVVEQVDDTIRLKYIEANGNLYFTSAEGIRKLSCLTDATIASEPITLAGGIPALDGTATLNQTPGWFLPDSAVAYRIVWGTTDNNTNVVLGVPSDRIVIYNSALSLLITDYNNLLQELTTASNVAPFTITGNTHTSTLVDNIATTNLSIGMTVSGSGVQSNTTIVAIPTNTSITLSLPTTTTVVGDSLTFGQYLTPYNFSALQLSANASSVALFAALQALANGNTNLLDTNIGGVYTTTGNFTANSLTVSSLASLANLAAGQLINSSSAPVGTEIVAVSPNYTQKGDVSTSSVQILNLPNTANILIGASVTGTYIPSNTFVTNILSSTSIEISNAATNTAAQETLTFNNNAITLSAPATVTSTTTSFTFGNNLFQTIPLSLTTIDNPATTGELTTLQAYYDAIVNQLNTIPGISSYARSFIAGAFTNSTTGITVNISFPIPYGITTAYYYQIYRSADFVSGVDSTIQDVVPDDELRLIFEGDVTEAQIMAGVVNFFDDVPESFRDDGANLYTNPISGAGIGQAYYAPPLSKDIALFLGSTFYANTQSQFTLSTGLLTAIGLAGGTLSITQGATTNTYTFVPSVAQITYITTPAGSAFPSTGPADYFDISSANNATVYRVWFNVSGGSNTAPSGVGVTLEECTILSGDTNAQVAVKLNTVLLNIVDFFSAIDGTNPNQVDVTNENTGYTNTPSNHVTAAGFSIVVNTPGSGTRASTFSVGVSNAATPALQIQETAQNLVSVINANSGSVVYAYYASGITDLPGLLEFTTINQADPSFTITTSSTAIGDLFTPALNNLASTNTINPNRLYYSVFQQPEAVPLLNYQDIGPKDKAIVRILPLRSSLIIFTEAGIYQLTGTAVANFQIVLFDSSTNLESADSAVTLNNQIFGLTNQGVSSISDTGVSVWSRPIENLIVPLLTANYTSFIPSTFAVGYESDRSYLLFTIVNTTDTVATVCYRFNVFTNSWTSWDVSKTCGVIATDVDIMYLGAGDVNDIEVERKNFNRQDQADRQYSLMVPTGGMNGYVLNLGAIFETTVGDVFTQTQYLTINQFNRLLTRLDTDAGLTQSNYETLDAAAGFNLRNSVSALATKLDSDSGAISTAGYVSSISAFTSSFSDTQAAFNVIVGLLNTGTYTRIKNYMTSTGTITYEDIVESINPKTFAITLLYPMPFIAGPITLYESIDCSIEWAPHHFGDASMLKHVSESTMLFENTDFTSAVASYASDLSPGLESIDFNGSGNGAWGQFNWGDIEWGGLGSSRPFRTYVPLNKQRCRFIYGEFEHNIAFESFAIFGISFSFQPISNRAYR